MSDGDVDIEGEGSFDDAAEQRAFGAESRSRIIADYLQALDERVTSANAWLHVYRLLLWINPTISLAHCYESDKCQPGKAWYPRSLAFHAWLSGQLGVEPEHLHDHLDYMFREAAPNLVRLASAERRAAAAAARAGYTMVRMPLPGDDSDLIDLIAGALGSGLAPGLLDVVATRRNLVEQLQAHFSLENKRKNLLGRGFEDVVAALIRTLPGSEDWVVRTRVPIREVPGFSAHGPALERAEVDLALWQKRGSRRILVTAKWSFRADRERQFDSDFDDYIKANGGAPFEHVLVTNEFDAARLFSAATKVYGNSHLFGQVVHVQPEGVLVAYGRDAADTPLPRDGTARGRRATFLRALLASGRIGNLGSWLDDVLSS